MKKMFLLILALFLAGGCMKKVHPDNSSSEPVALREVIHELTLSFSDIADDLEQAAGDVAAVQDDIDKIRDIVHRLYAEYSWASDVSYIDELGIMQVVEPPEFAGLQGRNISAQQHIRQIFIDNKPSMSQSFISVEGFAAVALQYPVMENDLFSGSVDMLLRPESLLKKIVEPKIQGLPVDIWVMEPGGRIIYDPDAEEIGRNIFTDKLYKPFPGLIDAARSISQTVKGMATYDFFGRGLKESVKKYAYWNTVTVFGTPWRIVLTKAEIEGVNGKKTLEELGLKSLNEAFREFVALEEMQEAIGRNDKPYLLSLFEEFYTNNPGLYSVQWVDEKCVTRFGYPAENSLNNYPFDKTKNPEQIQFINAVEKGREAFIELPLQEGNIGQMLLCPVTPKDKYRGMVYFLCIKP